MTRMTVNRLENELMGDFFRSAINYLSQASSAAGSVSSSSGRSHPMVGTTVRLNDNIYRVRSLLAEGGYALVFAVQDAQGGWFALKRQLAVDRAATEAIVKEIGFMRELSGHPNIVGYMQAIRQEMKDSPGRTEFFLLMEMCTGGPLIDVLQRDALTPDQICKIFYAACSAVQHMHDRNPPITHRDIKIENLLFDSRGFIRLCDFGSATTDIFRPDDDWSVSKRNLLEEEMTKYTTPMYRAPEILDTYQNHPIGPAQDVWALGCILYYMCYRQHPFEDSAKLRIINAKLTLPDADHTPYAMFHSIIRNSLQPNPYSRPTVGDLCEQVRELAYHMQINLNEPVLPSASGEVAGTAATQPLVGGSVSTQPPPASVGQSGAHGAATSEMFSQLRGQGLSLFKNLKDKSSSVIQNVQMGTTSLMSGYAAGCSASGSATPPTGRRHSPPPVPPPLQQRQPPHRVPPVPPAPDFFAEHPQQLATGRSSSNVARGPPPPSPPLLGDQHRVLPRLPDRPEIGWTLPPPVPPHQSAKVHQYFRQTSGDGRPQQNRDIGLFDWRGSSRPLTSLADYDNNGSGSSENAGASEMAEADFLGLGDVSKPDHNHKNSNGSAAAVANEPFDPFGMFPKSTGRQLSTASGAQNSAGGSSADVRQPEGREEEPILLFGGSAADHLSTKPSTHSAMDDLLGGPASSMARNGSAPSFTQSTVPSDAVRLEDDFLLLNTSERSTTDNRPSATDGKKEEFDLFDDFLASVPDSTGRTGGSNPGLSKPVSESTTGSAYQRINFENVRTAMAARGGGGAPTKPTANAFDDLLSAQGFSASSKQTNRTLADLQREENIRDMDPIAIKIRDWTTGKERNIRALLGSLSDVLWEDVEGRWTQPPMAELLSHVQIKKQYRKACLVVHPDKQTGTPHEPLAKAIFTELNDAWNAFEKSDQP